MLRIFFEKETYTIGEQVNISAEVTANGRFVDPDLGGVVLAILMNFTFGEGQPGDIQWIQMDPVPAERGKFTCSFVSQPWHVVVMEPQQEGLPLVGKVFFTMAMCAYFNVQATAMGVVMVEEGPVVNVAVNDHFPSPGDVVTVTITTTTLGSPTAAADVKVNLYSYDGETEADLGPLIVAEERPGVYKASYTLPIDLTEATMYAINAGASFTEYNASAYLYPLFGSGFMVNFFDVWFQNVTSDGDVTTIAAWVADLDGSALEGIDIDLDVNITGGSSSEIEQVSGTTDANGRYEFTIDHTGADRLDMQGIVSDGVRTQRVYMEGFVDNSEPQAPTPDPDDDDSSFVVEPWDTSDSGPIWDMIKEPGDPIHVKYRAFNDTGALTNKRINWYLIDRDGFLDTNWTTIDGGFEVTDGEGDFDLTFLVPDNDVNGWLMFEAVTWNIDEGRDERMETSEPLIDAGFFSRDENIKITVDRVHKDNPVELRANVPLPESYYIGQFFALFDGETGLTQWGQPQALGPMSDDFNIMPLPKMGPDVFGMDKQLPEFFPEDQSIAFMVLSVDLEMFRIQMNYVMLGYGESTTKGIDASQPNEPEPIHAGTNGTLEFEVENTGAGTDHYTVERMTGPDWLVWDNETISIEPSESGTFTAIVVVPEGINENRYYFNVTVRSDTDGSQTRDLALWVDVMVNGVEVSIDEPEMTAFRQETVEFVVAIKNTGQGNDTFAITMEGTAAGWASLSHSGVTVPEGGEVEVVVQVLVPDDADEDTYGIDLTATSGDGVTMDVGSMSVHVMVDGVEVEAGTDLVETWRSTTLSLTFEVTNTGQGSDTYTFTVMGDKAGWAILSDETLEIAEGEIETVLMEVTPPEDADSGFVDFILMAESANMVDNDTATTSVHVWVTGVTLTPDVDSMTGYRDEQIQFNVEVENTGLERDLFTFTRDNFGWATSVLFSQSNMAIDPEATGNLIVTVILSDSIDQGIYKFDVTATSEDGVTSKTIELEVKVTVNGVEITLSVDSVTITKGKEKEVTLTITNTGQGSDTFNILLTNAASNWTEAETTVVTLAEGLSQTITLTLSPDKKVKGDHAFLDITVVSTDPEFNAATQLQVVLKEPAEEGGLSAGVLIAIVVIIIILVGLVVYMMQAKAD